MATDANQIADSGAEDPNDTPNPDPNDTPDDQQEVVDDPAVVALAQEIGWTPREEYDGPPEKWKPASEFIRAGRDYQRAYREQIDGLNRKIDTIARTSASIVEDKVRERVAELAQRHQKAVDDGDPEKAFELASEISTITSNVGGPPQPSPEAQSWVERNSTWFQKPGHELASIRAVELTNMLARQGVTDERKQLAIVDQQMKKEFPELFKGGLNGRKPAAGVNHPSGRGSGVSNRQRGFSDLPLEAQKIARDMAERGVITDVDSYAKNYFANEKAKG